MKNTLKKIKESSFKTSELPAPLIKVVYAPSNSEGEDKQNESDDQMEGDEEEDMDEEIGNVGMEISNVDLDEKQTSAKPSNDRDTVQQLYLNPPPAPMLAKLDYENIQSHKNKWEAIAPDQRRLMNISSCVQSRLRTTVSLILNKENTKYKKFEDWQKISEEEFYDLLMKWFPRGIKDKTPGHTAEERLLATKLYFDGTTIEPVTAYSGIVCLEFENWEREHSSLLPAEVQKRCLKLIENILKKWKSSSTEHSCLGHLATKLLSAGGFTYYQDFMSVLLDEGKIIVDLVAAAQKIGMDFTYKGKGKEGNTKTNNKRPREDSDKKEEGREKSPRTMICNGCGRTNHAYEECKGSTHPDFNKDPNVPWDKSPNGIAWAQRLDKFGKPFTSESYFEGGFYIKTKTKSF